LFFAPEKKLVLLPDQLHLEYEDVSVPTDDGEVLHGWWLKSQQPAIGTVVFLHGNAQNISYHIASVRWLPQHGFNVFLYDYRGYGKSTGHPSIENMVNDVSSVLNALADAIPEQEQQYVIFGQSLGGSIAFASVARFKDDYPIKGLILDSAFSGFRRIAREKLKAFTLTRFFNAPLALLFAEQPDLLDETKSISPVPLVVIHGLADSIVPVHHARQIFAQADQPKQLWLQPGARHIQSLASKEIRELFLDFLNQRFLDQPHSNIFVAL
jgi:pimeloyl-ACP methyl ester carboxylesterase